MLIRTTDELRLYIPVDVNLDFNTVKPSVEEAEELYIKPLLGDYYPVLVGLYEAYVAALPTAITEPLKSILPYVQRSLAYYAMFHSVDHVGVNIGEIGIQQQSGANSQPAPRWKVRSLQLNYLLQGDRFADKLLEFLEDNASAVLYQEWFADIVANTKMSGSIVYSTKIASKHIDINESRRLFLRLKKRINEIEANNVKRLICKDQYDELITQLQTGTLTTENAALLTVLEPYIAKRALYLTLPSLAIQVSHEGITMFSSNDSVVTEQLAGTREKEELMRSLKDAEWNGYENDENIARQFIEDNISDYPLIEASPCWTSKADPGPKFTPDNDSCNKHFSV